MVCFLIVVYIFGLLFNCSYPFSWLYNCLYIFDLLFNCLYTLSLLYFCVLLLCFRIFFHTYMVCLLIFNTMFCLFNYSYTFGFFLFSPLFSYTFGFLVTYFLLYTCSYFIHIWFAFQCFIQCTYLVDMKKNHTHLVCIFY